jgi:hypothetical protein
MISILSIDPVLALSSSVLSSPLLLSLSSSLLLLLSGGSVGGGSRDNATIGSLGASLGVGSSW